MGARGCLCRANHDDWQLPDSHTPVFTTIIKHTNTQRGGNGERVEEGTEVEGVTVILTSVSCVINPHCSIPEDMEPWWLKTLLRPGQLVHSYLLMSSGPVRAGLTTLKKTFSAHFKVYIHGTLVEYLCVMDDTVLFYSILFSTDPVCSPSLKQDILAPVTLRSNEPTLFWSVSFWKLHYSWLGWRQPPIS